MLIVAIPKSASTALLSTLGEQHDLPARQLSLRENSCPNNLSLLHKYHSDIRELDKDMARTFVTERRLYKQHIPPTPRNLTLLRGAPKVVLLREPKEIVAAYYRAEQMKIHSPRPEFDGIDTMDAWQERATEIGLYADLKWFYDAWREESVRDPGNTLVLQYEELVGAPQATVNRAEEFLNLPLTDQVRLKKRRYSRNGPVRSGLVHLSSCANAFVRRHPRLKQRLRPVTSLLSNNCLMKRALRWRW